MTTIDYDAWAKTYDDTRGASPSVLRALLEAVGPAGRADAARYRRRHRHLAQNDMTRAPGIRFRFALAHPSLE